MNQSLRGSLLALSLTGFLASTAAAEISKASLRPTMVDLRVAALLLSGQQGGELPLAAFAYPAPLASQPSLIIQIDLDGLALREHFFKTEDGTSPQALDFDVFLYALDDQLAVRAQSSNRFTLTADALEDDGLQGVRFCDALELPPGATDLRILVATADRERFGLRRLRDEPTADPEVRLPPPLIAEEDRWLIVAAEDTHRLLQTALPAPWSLENLPASRPILVPGTVIEAQLWTGDVVAPQAPIARLTPSDGVNSIREMTVSERQANDRALTVKMPVPSLEAGFYDLSFHWKDGTDTALISPPITAPITVFVPESTPIQTTEPPRPRTDAQDLSAAPKIKAEDLDDLAFAYIDALRLLPTASNSSVEALRQLEQTALTRYGDAAFTALERAEGRFVDRLKGADWQAVWPVLWLHAELVRAHRRADSFSLTLHANHRTTTLAQAYARALDSEPARRRASLLLIELASFFQRHGPLARAAELYKQALQIAPHSAEALLGIAVLDEKQGRPSATLEPLETLMHHHPDHPEGRLRLAINLGRAGNIDAARKHFLLLTQKRAHLPSWIAILAYQEWARLEFLAGQDQTAMETLEQGLTHWPNQPGLRLQLGAALRAKRDPQADLWLTLVDKAPSGLTPRTRYNLWYNPPANLATELLTEKDLQLDALASLLSRFKTRQPEEPPP